MIIIVNATENNSIDVVGKKKKREIHLILK